MAHQVPQDQLELGQQGPQDHPEHQGQADLWVQQGLQVRADQRVLVPLVHRGPQDRREYRDQVDLRVALVQVVHLVQLEVLGLQVPRVLQAHLELEQPVLRVRVVLQVQLGVLAELALQVLVDPLAELVLVDRLDLQEQQDLRVLQAP